MSVSLLAVGGHRAPNTGSKYHAIHSVVIVCRYRGDVFILGDLAQAEGLLVSGSLLVESATHPEPLRPRATAYAVLYYEGFNRAATVRSHGPVCGNRGELERDVAPLRGTDQAGEISSDVVRSRGVTRSRLSMRNSGRPACSKAHAISSEQNQCAGLRQSRSAMKLSIPVQS